MSAEGWIPLAGLDPDAAAFPARARLEDEDIVVFRIGEGYRGVQRACPHQKASLGDAMVVGEGRMLRCALHGYAFKLADGKGVNCPGYRIKVYEIMRAAGRLLARDPAAQAGTTTSVEAP